MAKQANTNENYIGPDNIIYSFWRGDQNPKTVAKMEEDLKALTTQLKSQKKSVLILSDLTKLSSKIPLSARISGGKLIHNLVFDRVAIYGNYFKLQGLVDAVIIASGCRYKMKYFIDPQSAKKWLLEYST